MNDESPVAREIHINYLDVGVGPANVIGPGELATDLAIAALVVDCVNPDASVVRWIVMEVKHAHLTHQMGAKILAYKTFVPVIGPHFTQNRHRVAAAGDLWEPFSILNTWLGNNSLNVAHHRKAQGIRIKSRITRIIIAGLEDSIGVRLQELKKVSVPDPTTFMQAGHYPVMHVGRSAFVHDLRLCLRIKVLRDMADNPKQLPLPRLQPRR